MNCICYLTKDKGEVASGIVQRAAFPCDTERLTRRPSAEEVGSFDLSAQNALRERGHIAVIGYIWEAMR